MKIVMWQTKRIIISVVLALFVFFILKARNYSYHKNVILHNVQAEELWEFLADFSNSEKYLNPHLKIVNIENEIGNYKNWKYSVHYTEPFPDWPHFNSEAVGHYTVIRDAEKYIIKSTHHTCILNGLWCTVSECDFRLTQLKKNTRYEEEITFKCPPLVSSWCLKTNSVLREVYFNNMIKHFKMTFTE